MPRGEHGGSDTAPTPEKCKLGEVAAQSFDWVQTLCSVLLADGAALQWEALSASNSFWRRQRANIVHVDLSSKGAWIDEHPLHRLSRPIVPTSWASLGRMPRLEQLDASFRSLTAGHPAHAEDDE